MSNNEKEQIKLSRPLSFKRRREFENKDQVALGVMQKGRNGAVTSTSALIDIDNKTDTQKKLFLQIEFSYKLLSDDNIKNELGNIFKVVDNLIKNCDAADNEVELSKELQDLKKQLLNVIEKKIQSQQEFSNLKPDELTDKANSIFNLMHDLSRLSNPEFKSQYINYVMHGVSDYYTGEDLKGNYENLKDSGKVKDNQKRFDDLARHKKNTIGFFDSLRSEELKEYLVNAPRHKRTFLDRKGAFSVFATNSTQDVFTKLLFADRKQFQEALVANVVKQLEVAGVKDVQSNLFISTDTADTKIEKLIQFLENKKAAFASNDDSWFFSEPNKKNTGILENFVKSLLVNLNGLNKELEAEKFGAEAGFNKNIDSIFSAPVFSEETTKNFFYMNEARNKNQSERNSLPNPQISLYRNTCDVFYKVESLKGVSGLHALRNRGENIKSEQNRITEKIKKLDNHLENIDARAKELISALDKQKNRLLNNHVLYRLCAYLVEELKNENVTPDRINNIIIAAIEKEFPGYKKFSVTDKNIINDIMNSFANIIFVKDGENNGLFKGLANIFNLDEVKGKEESEINKALEGKFQEFENVIERHKEELSIQRDLLRAVQDNLEIVQFNLDARTENALDLIKDFFELLNANHDPIMQVFADDIINIFKDPKKFNSFIKDLMSEVDTLNYKEHISSIFNAVGKKFDIKGKEFGWFRTIMNFFMSRHTAVIDFATLFNQENLTDLFNRFNNAFEAFIAITKDADSEIAETNKFITEAESTLQKAQDQEKSMNSINASLEHFFVDSNQLISQKKTEIIESIHSKYSFLMVNNKQVYYPKELFENTPYGNLILDLINVYLNDNTPKKVDFNNSLSEINMHFWGDNVIKINPVDIAQIANRFSSLAIEIPHITKITSSEDISDLEVKYFLMLDSKTVTDAFTEIKTNLILITGDVQRELGIVYSGIKDKIEKNVKEIEKFKGASLAELELTKGKLESKKVELEGKLKDVAAKIGELSGSDDKQIIAAVAEYESDQASLQNEIQKLEVRLGEIQESEKFSANKIYENAISKELSNFLSSKGSKNSVFDSFLVSLRETLEIEKMSVEDIQGDNSIVEQARSFVSPGPRRSATAIQEEIDKQYEEYKKILENAKAVILASKQVLNSSAQALEQFDEKLVKHSELVERHKLLKELDNVKEQVNNLTANSFSSITDILHKLEVEEKFISEKQKKSTQYQELQSDIEKTKADIKIFKAREEKYLANIEELKELNYDTSKDDNNSLKDKIENIAAECGKYNNEKQLLAKEISLLDETLASLLNRVQYLTQERLVMLQSKASRTLGSLQEVGDQVESCRKSLEKLKNIGNDIQLFKESISELHLNSKDHDTLEKATANVVKTVFYRSFVTAAIIADRKSHRDILRISLFNDIPNDDDIVDRDFWTKGNNALTEYSTEKHKFIFNQERLAALPAEKVKFGNILDALEAPNESSSSLPEISRLNFSLRADIADQLKDECNAHNNRVASFNKVAGNVSKLAKSVSALQARLPEKLGVEANKLIEAYKDLDSIISESREIIENAKKISNWNSQLIAVSDSLILIEEKMHKNFGEKWDKNMKGYDSKTGVAAARGVLDCKNKASKRTSITPDNVVSGKAAASDFDDVTHTRAQDIVKKDKKDKKYEATLGIMSYSVRSDGGVGPIGNYGGVLNSHVRNGYEQTSREIISSTTKPAVESRKISTTSVIDNSLNKQNIDVSKAQPMDISTGKKNLASSYEEDNFVSSGSYERIPLRNLGYNSVDSDGDSGEDSFLESDYRQPKAAQDIQADKSYNPFQMDDESIQADKSYNPFQMDDESIQADKSYNPFKMEDEYSYNGSTSLEEDRGYNPFSEVGISTEQSAEVDDSNIDIDNYDLEQSPHRTVEVSNRTTADKQKNYRATEIEKGLDAQKISYIHQRDICNFIEAITQGGVEYVTTDEKSSKITYHKTSSLTPSGFAFASTIITPKDLKSFFTTAEYYIVLFGKIDSSGIVSEDLFVEGGIVHNFLSAFRHLLMLGASPNELAILNANKTGRNYSTKEGFLAQLKIYQGIAKEIISKPIAITEPFQIFANKLGKGGVNHELFKKEYLDLITEFSVLFGKVEDGSQVQSSDAKSTVGQSRQLITVEELKNTIEPGVENIEGLAKYIQGTSKIIDHLLVEANVSKGNMDFYKQRLKISLDLLCNLLLKLVHGNKDQQAMVEESIALLKDVTLDKALHQIAALIYETPIVKSYIAKFKGIDKKADKKKVLNSMNQLLDCVQILQRVVYADSNRTRIGDNEFAQNKFRENFGVNTKDNAKSSGNNSERFFNLICFMTTTIYSEKANSAEKYRILRERLIDRILDGISNSRKKLIIAGFNSDNLEDRGNAFKAMMGALFRDILLNEEISSIMDSTLFKNRSTSLGNYADMLAYILAWGVMYGSIKEEDVGSLLNNLNRIGNEKWLASFSHDTNGDGEEAGEDTRFNISKLNAFSLLVKGVIKLAQTNSKQFDFKSMVKSHFNKLEGNLYSYIHDQVEGNDSSNEPGSTKTISSGMVDKQLKENKEGSFASEIDQFFKMLDLMETLKVAAKGKIKYDSTDVLNDNLNGLNFAS